MFHDLVPDASYFSLIISGNHRVDLSLDSFVEIETIQLDVGSGDHRNGLVEKGDGRSSMSFL